jgi:glutathione synthase/RimK-type ligase-like ATP-grasp enzyme
VFQEKVEKRVELRVTVVGERVFAAEIDSQRSHRSAGDWRRHDPAHVAVRAATLPMGVRAAARELVRRLDLSYGALDFIERPNGELVFLEVNPTGEYLWIEDSTQLPITAAICDWLCGEAHG